MGELGDRMNALTIRAKSPDGRISGIVRGGKLEDCEFSEDAYLQYTGPVLEYQIARLATLLYTGYERGLGVIRAEAGLEPRQKDPASADNEAEKRYLERVFSISVEAAGSRDVIWLVTTGMMEWECDISEGALDELSECEFLQELVDAGRAVMSASEYEVALLKDEYFGLGVPALAAERKRRKARHRWP